MNKFKIVFSKERDFVRLKKVVSYLDKVPGFKRLKLFKGNVKENHALYNSHCILNAKEAFINSTKTETFRFVHRNEAIHRDLYLEAHDFKSFKVVL